MSLIMSPSVEQQYSNQIKNNINALKYVKANVYSPQFSSAKIAIFCSNDWYFAQCFSLSKVYIVYYYIQLNP